MVEVMIDGRRVQPDEARISVFDHGFLYGDMVYEVVKAMDGKFFALAPHLQRLRYSASMIELDIPWDDAFLRAEMATMVKLVDTPHAYLRLVITRGEGPLSLEPGRCKGLTRILYGKEHLPLDPKLYQEGVGIFISLPLVREQGNIKSSVYRNNVQAIKQARGLGFHEAVLLDKHDQIAECTTSNIFWTRDGVLHTPSLGVGILKGVTRQLVIHLAQSARIDVREGSYPATALLEADEVFITSTTRDILPVNRVGDHSKQIGPMTRSLMAGFAEMGNVELDWALE